MREFLVSPRKKKSTSIQDVSLRFMIDSIQQIDYCCSTIYYHSVNLSKIRFQCGEKLIFVGKEGIKWFEFEKVSLTSDIVPQFTVHVDINMFTKVEFFIHNYHNLSFFSSRHYSNVSLYPFPSWCSPRTFFFLPLISF